MNVTWRRVASVVFALLFLGLIGIVHSALSTLDVGREYVPEQSPEKPDPYSYIVTPDVDTDLVRYILIFFTWSVCLFVIVGMAVLAVKGDFSLIYDFFHKLILAFLMVLSVTLTVQIVTAANERKAWVRTGGTFMDAVGGFSDLGGGAPVVETARNYVPFVLLAFMVVAVVVSIIVTVRSVLIPAYELATFETVELEQRRRVLGALDKSVDELRSGIDVRRAIIYCYMQLEDTVERKGRFESDNMTPRELRGIIESTFMMRSDSLDTLVDLFEEARYSVHPLDEAKRDVAVDSLLRFRAQLEGRA